MLHVAEDLFDVERVVATLLQRFLHGGEGLLRPAGDERQARTGDVELLLELAARPSANAPASRSTTRSRPKAAASARPGAS